PNPRRRLNTKDSTSFTSNPVENSAISATKLLSCFFDTIDCLISKDNESNPHSFSTEKIRNKIQEKCETYLHCTFILNNIAEIAESRGFFKKQDSVDIHDTRLQNFLEKNLKTNIKAHRETFILNETVLNEEICDKYINSFVAYYYEIKKDLPKKNPLDWIKLVSKCENLPNFVLYEASSSLLKEMNILEDFALLEYRLTGTFEENQTAKTSALFNFLQRKVASEYGFKIEPSWHPEQSFNEFTTCIRTYGYLVVGGLFGEGYYSEPPIDKTIGELQIFTWKKGTFREENSFLAHEIIIIGASRAGYAGTTQDLIYFTDPTDINSKIFSMSYGAFGERLGTTNSCLASGLKKIGKDITKFNYLFYHPQLAPKTQAGFWVEPDCKTVTKVVLAAGAVATGIGLALSKTM
ncbi:MAG: hypothetical protein WBE18_07030, partial [Gammaproteobacteria bacterium]